MFACDLNFLGKLEISGQTNLVKVSSRVPYDDFGDSLLIHDDMRIAALEAN